MLKLQCFNRSLIPKQGSAVTQEKAGIAKGIAGIVSYFALAGNLNTNAY